MLSICNKSRAASQPNEDPGVALVAIGAGAIAPAVLEQLSFQALKIFKTPIAASELTGYKWGGTLISALASAGLAPGMGTNLYMISNDFGAATLAMSGTFYLAAANVYQVLQPGGYKSFLARMKSPTVGSGEKVRDVVINMISLASGVIISMADAETAGIGMANKFCRDGEVSGGSAGPQLNATTCSEINNGYYGGCQNTRTGNTTAFDEPAYNACEKVVFGAVAAWNGIPKGIVGATSIKSVLSYLSGLSIDTYRAFKTLATLGVKGSFSTQAQLAAMKLEPKIIDALNAVKDFGTIQDARDAAGVLSAPDTGRQAFAAVAAKLRGAYSPSSILEAVKYIKDSTLVPTTSAVGGAAVGIIKFGALAGTIFVITPAASDIYNANKNLDYYFKNGWSTETGPKGTPVVQFPDGTWVDPYDNDFKVNKTYVNSFLDHMSAATGAQQRSTISYSAKSIMIGTYGVIRPMVYAFQVIAALNMAYKMAGSASGIPEYYPVDVYYFPSTILSLALTSVGFNFYARNLEGAIEGIERLRAIRKATGQEAYIDNLMSPTLMVRVTQAVLAGVFTVGGALAIQPFIALFLKKAVDLTYRIRPLPGSA